MTRQSESERLRGRFVSRRDFLFRAGEGIGGIALAYLLNQDGLLAAPARAENACGNSAAIASPFSPKPPHFKPRAKAVISLFMDGGVSHVDTFDPKPALEKYHGQPLPVKGEVQVQQGFPGPIMRSPYKFKPYGQSGIQVSELFPHMADLRRRYRVDSLRAGQIERSLHLPFRVEHRLAAGRAIRASGSWVTYGLGTENQNLPAYVVIYDPRGGPYNGPSNWGAGFLPASYQATTFRASGDPILDLNPPPGSSRPEEQRARLDHLAWLNAQHEEKHPGSSELAARIASYELAYRMQGCAPEAVDLSKETEATRRLYGLDQAVRNRSASSA